MATRQTDLDAHSVIETERLRLEPWNDGHFERFARSMRNPDVIRYIRAEPLGPARALEQHQRSLEEWDVHGFGKRAVIDAETEQWLGFVELSLVGPRKGSRDDDIEIGYFVEPSRWGEGIATEAATAARDEAFDRCGIAELIGRCRGGEHRLGAGALEGGLPAATAVRARRRDHRRDPPPDAHRLDRTDGSPPRRPARRRPEWSELP